VGSDAPEENKMDTHSPDVSISNSAARRIAWILQAEPGGTALRISVSGGGCSGFQYSFELDASRSPDDLIVERDGATVLIDRAMALSEAGEFRLACHLADLAGWAAPADAGVHALRATIYRARRASESSLMAKGIFAGAARDSEVVSG